MHHIPDRLLSPARLQTTALQRIGIKLYCYAGGLLIAPMTRLFLFFELHEKIAKNDYEKLKTSKTLNQRAPDCAPLVFSAVSTTIYYVHRNSIDFLAHMWVDDRISVNLEK